MLQVTFCYCLLKFRPNNDLSMTRTSLLFFLTLLTILLSTTTSAQTDPEQEERWFQTEIIVFEVIEKNHAILEELWPDDPGVPGIEDSLELSPVPEESEAATEPAGPEKNIPPATQEITAQPPEQPFQRLPNEALTLTALADKLSNASNYAPLLHIAWRQPMLEKTAAKKIRIHTDQGIDDQPHASLGTIPTFVNVTELMPPPALIESPLMLTTIDETNPVRSLDGTIKLHLGRYLHLETDLLYRSHQPPAAPLVNNTFLMSINEVKPPPTQFRMQQTRRLRSGELHYLDHPMFGMLILITPYELPVPPEPEPKPIPEPAPVSTTDVATPAPLINEKKGNVAR